MKTPLCIYCQRNESSTGDHVPPRSLIRKAHRNSLVKVPACLECNNGFSKDEEYFRLIVVGLLCHTSEAEELFEGPISRSMDYRKNMEDLMFGSLEPDADRVALDCDYARVGRIVEKIWRGVEYAFADTLHPPDSHVQWALQEVDGASSETRFAPDFSYGYSGGIREFTFFDSARFYAKRA